MSLGGPLRAAAPGWTARADVVVVGSGVAGLTVALGARAAGLRVLLVTKTRLSAGSTVWAQGGIAAALGPGDTPSQHEQDTLVAGVGLCDPQAVQALVTEGPGAVRQLIAWGAVFDRTPAGELALTREGGHLRDRIAHAGGDATGAEISRALLAAVLDDPGVEVIEHALALDVLRDSNGRAVGVTLHVVGEGSRDGVGAVLARAVVLATGGLGQVFAATTNPPVSAGDGLAMALRAGAAVADLEFVQFHPTVLYIGPGATGQQPLVSEAVRGEGAVLVDDTGARVMAGVHPLGDLAPRDVVAKAITRRMRESGARHVWLDARGLGAQTWEQRFPTIRAACRLFGVDPVTELVPVLPAEHYSCGGVRTDTFGRTTVPGLYAVGEVACTGVHGANRLASNSLLEGLVFAQRLAGVLPGDLPATSLDPAPDSRERTLLDPSVRVAAAEAVSAGVGVIRSAATMDAAAATLQALASRRGEEVSATAWEASNVHLVASVLTAVAAVREETRGTHWREDFPDRDDIEWRQRTLATLTNGVLTLTHEEVLP